VVLLTNDGPILPLAPAARIAVIGEFARTPRFRARVAHRSTPPASRTPSTKLAATFAEVTFAAGWDR
jgi:beta-glucosidase